MAEKRRVEDDFSIILGKRVIKDEKKEKSAKVKKTPGAKPKVHETVEKRPDIAVQSLDELLKRKDELEAFMQSLDDAHKSSKFPEYTYDRLKKKMDVELINVNKEIEKRGYKEVKKETEKLNSDINTIKKVVSSAKTQGEKALRTDYDQKPGPEYHRIEMLENEMRDLSEKLEHFYNRLKDGVDKVYSGADREMVKSVRYLKNEMDTIKSRLSDFVRKSELNFVTGTPSKVPVRRDPEDVADNVVQLDELSNNVGKTVIINSKLSLFNKADKGKTKLYWYRIDDGTDTCIMTSYEKLGEKVAKIVGEVKKTAGGSCYILFKHFA
ncbi:MAG: hypothetical protein JSV63_01235 [Candidatus Aenigmatarchaeota archaeon]|nr:MAG: hypothetical protein JSV63_01235 [Candidatus Aenigmarchaeota archaeon]